MKKIVKKMVSIMAIMSIITVFSGCTDSVLEKARIEAQEESVLEKATIELKEAFADQISDCHFLGFNGKKFKNTYHTVFFLNTSNANQKNYLLYKSELVTLSAIKVGLIHKCANDEEAKDIVSKCNKNREVWFQNSKYTYWYSEITDVSNPAKSLVGCVIVEGKSKEEIEKSINDPEFESFVKSVMSNE